MSLETHDHMDGGLRNDLALIARSGHERRQLLGWLMSGGAAALLIGCGGSSDSSSSSSSSSSGSSSSACIADPAETDGPFPADGTNTVNGEVVNVLTQSGIVRSDITSSFGSASAVATGVPLTLTITLAGSNSSCAMLVGYAVYVWHCNENGEYSLYASDLLDQNYLRGVQVSDSESQVVFETIFPACYSGRYPHIHVEVYETLASASSQANALLTTQLAMPTAVCSNIFDNDSGYSGSSANFAEVTTSTDTVFASSSAAQIAAQTPTMSGSIAEGYTATVTIGLDI